MANTDPNRVYTIQLNHMQLNIIRAAMIAASKNPLIRIFLEAQPGVDGENQLEELEMLINMANEAPSMQEGITLGWCL